VTLLPEQVILDIRGRRPRKNRPPGLPAPTRPVVSAGRMLGAVVVIGAAVARVATRWNDSVTLLTLAVTVPLGALFLVVYFDNLRHARITVTATEIRRIGVLRTVHVIDRRTVDRSVLLLALVAPGRLKVQASGAPARYRQGGPLATTTLFLLDRAGRRILRLTGAEHTITTWWSGDVVRLCQVLGVQTDHYREPIEKGDLAVIYPSLLRWPELHATAVATMVFGGLFIVVIGICALVAFG